MDMLESDIRKIKIEEFWIFFLPELTYIIRLQIYPIVPGKLKDIC